jgi:hypothetical protein
MPALAVDGESNHRPDDIFPKFHITGNERPNKLLGLGRRELGLHFRLGRLVLGVISQAYLLWSCIRCSGCRRCQKLGSQYELSADVSAISEQSLTAKLLVDQNSKRTQRLGLQEQKGASRTIIHRSFFFGPDLRIKTNEVSSSSIRRTCHQTMQLLTSIQRAASRASELKNNLNSGQDFLRHSHRKRFLADEIQSLRPELITLGKSPPYSYRPSVLRKENLL